MFLWAVRCCLAVQGGVLGARTKDNNLLLVSYHKQNDQDKSTVATMKNDERRTQDSANAHTLGFVHYGSKPERERGNSFSGNLSENGWTATN